MINNARLLESNKINVSTFSLSSVSATSKVFHANDCNEVSIIVGLGTVIAGVQSTITIDQGNDKNLTTSAGLSSATLSVLSGSSSTGRVERASGIVLTLTSSTNTVLTINGISLTQSTSSALIATTANTTNYGATVGTTAEGGQKAVAENLIARLNSTYGSSVIGPGGFGSLIRASSVTTADVYLYSLDGENLTSGLTVLSDSTLISPAYLSQQVALSFKTDELNATSEYFKVGISTVATAVACNITVIKSGLRYGAKGNIYGSQTISI